MISLHTSTPGSGLQWLKPNEFRYRGKMYDVVDSTWSNDTIHYLCYPDHRENLLYQKITRMVNDAFGHHPVNKEHQKQIRNFFKSTYLPVALAGDHYSLSVQAIVWPCFREQMKNLWPEPLQPPPRKG